MTISLPSRPATSAFHVHSSRSGATKLLWRPPFPGGGRWGIAAVLVIWLCGWGYGELETFRSFLAAFSGPAGMNLCSGLFLLIPLAGWTVGGLLSLLLLLVVVLPPQPEIFTLSDTVFRHEPPRWLAAGDSAHSSTIASSKLEIARASIGPIRLERVGHEQRLTIQHGAEQVEIGRGMTEPDREWLAAVLRSWSGQPA